MGHCVVIVWSLCDGGEGRKKSYDVFTPRGADLRLFQCFVLVHFDGGDGMLGARLHLPVHLPLGILRLGLEQVHSLLCFDPAGKEKGKNRMSQFYYS